MKEGISHGGKRNGPDFMISGMKDRFTDLSFALGNKLPGVLDKKQHEERADESKHVGWYKKTDFEISAVIEGEDFHYEGRLDIGDGEGDLIVHIKNFYDYSLSPNCPFIPECRRKGEDYYREQMETLHWGQDVFVPFLEQHTELTAEDERLFAEIMAIESDWFHRGKEFSKEELLEKAKHWIDTFCSREYGSDTEADYTDLSNVKLAFTTTEDELHEIQASVNFTEYRMETYIDDTLVGYTQYEDLGDMI